MNTTTRYASLQDRLVFISGGSSGIGAELVRAFAAQGSRVAFCGTRAEGGRELIDEVTAAGLPVPVYTACDVRDTTAYQALLAATIARHGPVHVLINNAGRDDRHRMEEVTPELWDDRLSLNLKHYFFAIQAVAPAMAAAGGGAIINMGSVSWMRGRPNLVGYTTAKAGILGLTRTLARELGARNIRVNAVVPGAIVTERQNALHRDAAADQTYWRSQLSGFEAPNVLRFQQTSGETHKQTAVTAEKAVRLPEALTVALNAVLAPVQSTRQRAAQRPLPMASASRRCHTPPAGPPRAWPRQHGACGGCRLLGLEPSSASEV